MGKSKIAFIVAAPMTARVFLMDHIECLQKKYEVHLIANFTSNEDKLEFIKKDIVCHTVSIMRAIQPYADIKALIALTKLFKNEKFDCVHSVTPKAGLLTSLAGKIARIPNRIHIFTGQVWATRKGIMRRILKSMDKLIAKYNTCLLVDGEGQRQFLIKEGVLKENNSLVPAEGSIAGIKLERFIVSEEIRKEERKKFNFSEEDVVFIFLGRLNHDKGIGELYEAFNQLCIDCPNARLLIYGIDEEGYDTRISTYKNIKKGTNYFYPGPTRTPYKALQAGDIFVLPTWREGFGVSVLEAQALELPVITSNTYGVVDASIENVTGLRCNVNDPKSLYLAMKKYYENADIRKKHGKAGRKRVVEKFNNERVSQAWLSIYDTILKDKLNN